MKELFRAIVIVIATTVQGAPAKEGKVMLVPEDISSDNAKALLGMARPRAQKASESQTKKRLAEYEKEQKEIGAKKKAAQEAADKIAEENADLIAIAEAEANAAIKAAEEARAKAEKETAEAEAATKAAQEAKANAEKETAEAEAATKAAQEGKKK